MIGDQTYWIAYQGNLVSNAKTTFGIGYVQPTTSDITIYGNYDLYDTDGTEKEFKISYAAVVKLGIKVPETTTAVEADKEETEHNWIKSLSTFTCENCGKKYKMKELINYTPTIKNISSIVSTSESGYTEQQTINQEIGKEWTVLTAIDTDDNGTNESLVIKMNPTTSLLYLTGRQAYNNGPDIMDRICKELYSNDLYGESRSIKIEDLNSALDYKPKGGEYYYGGQWNTLSGFKNKLSSLQPYSNITSFYTPDETNTTEKLGIYEVNGYHYTLTSSFLKDANGKTIKSYSSYDTIEEIRGNYWLSTKGILLKTTDKVTFGPGYVKTTGYGGGEWNYLYVYIYTNYDSFSNYGEENTIGKSICPVVLLGLKLPE